MRFFTFHIGDWVSHTWHLSPLEKAAYLAMIIEEATHEKPLPYDVEKIATRINMRTHCDCIANVLREFYECIEGEEKGYSNKRVRQEIEAAKEKSAKAKASAEARWNKASKKSNANALRAQSEGNATNNHKPITKNKGSRFTPPTVSEVKAYCDERKNDINPQAFVDYYEANGWMRGKNKIKDWKACVRTWEQNSNNKPAKQEQIQWV